MSGAVPPLAARPLGRAARVLRPVSPGCGWCGRGDPAPAQRRAPLRAGVAHLGGGGRASPEGPPFANVRGVWGQALPLTRLPALCVLWAWVCGCGGPAPAPWPACPVGGCAPRGWRGASGFRRPLFPAARRLGGLLGPAGRVPWVRVWVCVVWVVPVRCVLWCWVLPLACPSGAALSGALLRCCAPRVLAVPPFLARVPCSSAGYLPSLSWLRRSLPFPQPPLWLALLPGMHVFPASVLVCVLVFPLACFLGPSSRALFFLSCRVL